MLHVVVISHASRLDTKQIADRETPLTPLGETECQNLARLLAARNIKPGAYFSSWFRHAKETAADLRILLNGIDSPVLELCTLTPSFPGDHPDFTETRWAELNLLAWLLLL